MTRHNTDDGSTGSTSRRGFVKLGVGAGAAAAGIAAGSSPVRSQFSPTASALASSKGVQYLVGRAIEDVKDHFTGLSEPSDFDDLTADQLHLKIRSDSIIIQNQNELTLTQIENLMQNAKTACYQIGRASVLEQLNNGVAPANTLTAATNEMENYITPNQKNLIKRWNIAVSQIETQLANVESTPQLDKYSVWQRLRIDQNDNQYTTGGFDSIQEASVTLVDGSSQDYLGLRAYNDNDSSLDQRGIDPYGNLDSYSADLSLRVKPTDSGSLLMVLPTVRFKDLHNQFQTIFDEAVSELETFVNGIKDSYNAGDITTEEIATPRDLWAMSSDDAETPYAAADLAGLGLEVNQDSAVVVHLLTDDTKLEGSVYLSESPIGDSLATGNVYDPGLSRSTDSNGNHNDSVSDYAGSESDPIPLDGLTFIAYNTDSGSTYDQVKQPFRVDSIFGEDGEELQAASYQPSTGQQTTTTDIDELRSELKSLNDEIVELEEEKREIATGGGGGGGGGSSLGTLAAAAAGGGLLLALLTGGGN